MTETRSTDTLRQTLQSLLEPRLGDSGLDFIARARRELAQGVALSRFAALLAMASRHAKRQPLTLAPPEQDKLQKVAPQVSLQAWNLLELVRVHLMLSREDLHLERFAEDFEAQFAYADEGETCALYRALAFLPAGERFVWRAGEGCRSNMLSVFNAIALDSPYPANHFGQTAWNQLVMKALFLEQPLWRIVGLDKRRTAELTRMALDFAEERESAGRALVPGLWLCLDATDPERVAALAERHYPGGDPGTRAAIALGLARAGQAALAESLAQAHGGDAQVLAAIGSEPINQTQYARLVAGEDETTP